MIRQIEPEGKAANIENDKEGSIRVDLPMTKKADREIWNAFIQGDRSAFIYIYNTFFDEIFAYARQFTNDQELIKDAMQDLFIRLNDSRERLSETDSIKFYLFKSVKREIFRALKKRRYSDDQLKAIKGRSFEYEVSFEEKLINRLTDEEIIRKVRDAANNLNERQREIIFYHFFEGFSIKQIRELMSFGSEQATHNLLNRALVQLKAIMNAWIIFWAIFKLYYF